MVKSVKVVDLSTNKLNGSIPVEIGEANSLKELRLEKNLVAKFHVRLGIAPLFVLSNMASFASPGTRISFMLRSLRVLFSGCSLFIAFVNPKLSIYIVFRVSYIGIVLHVLWSLCCGIYDIYAWKCCENYRLNRISAKLLLAGETITMIMIYGAAGSFSGAIKFFKKENVCVYRASECLAATWLMLLSYLAWACTIVTNVVILRLLYYTI